MPAPSSKPQTHHTSLMAAARSSFWHNRRWSRQYSIQSQPSTPSIIYLADAIKTLTVPFNGVPTSCAICYDLRTGEQYYAIPVSQGGITPTALSYNAPATSNAQDLGTAAGGFTVDLISLTGGRLYKIDPYSGAASLNISIAPLTTGVFYNNNYMISVQTIMQQPVNFDW